MQKIKDKKDHSVLELGTSVASSLFVGRVVEENLFPFPSFSADEVQTLHVVLDSMERFFESNPEKFKEFDAAAAQPEEYIAELKELGLFGMIIPEEYGGSGLSTAAYSRIIQTMCRYDSSSSLTVGAHCSIGIKGVLLVGTTEQKRRYLSRLASGELIAAFCLTEAGAGSDAAAVRTSAKKNEDGTWTLNGEKIWITNGPIADLFTVFAKTGEKPGELSAFLVERAWRGVSSGPKEEKMGIRASATSSVLFDNVCIPAENLLGNEGEGFKIAMRILNSGRSGLGGGCVGAMKRAIELAIEHAQQRKQFGKKLSEFGLIQDKLARMNILCFAGESLVSMVAGLIDRGSKEYSVEAAISKVFVTEALWIVANDALQIAGGNGYMKGYPFERIVRDARINLIFEGTNEILRLYIALSGMKAAGRYLGDVQKGLEGFFNAPIESLGLLSEYAVKKASQFTPFGRERLNFPQPELRDAAGVYERYVPVFASSVEALLRRYKKEIVNKQFVLSRIADTAIDLFSGLCVLSRAATLGPEMGQAERQQIYHLATVYSQQAKRRMNQRLRRIDRNEDGVLKCISDYAVERGRYPWDTL